MPIRPDLRHLYRGAAWEATRERILARAGNCCESCGKPNHAKVLTCSGGYNFMAWSLLEGDPTWRNGRGRELEWMPTAFPPRIVRVRLGVAHLNHVAGDDRDVNLKALCAWCHFNYDKFHHRETRAGRKDAARPLLGSVATRQNV